MRTDPDPYLVQQVATASKAMLTSMLFSAAVANTQRAIVQLDEGHPQPARRFFIRAQEIVLELRMKIAEVRQDLTLDGLRLTWRAHHAG